MTKRRTRRTERDVTDAMTRKSETRTLQVHVVYYDACPDGFKAAWTAP